MVYKSIDELISNTPLLELGRIKEKYKLKANIYAKLEKFNPGGSSKDRIAKKMIEDAEDKGILKKGSVIIEPTSGNTGVGLSMIGAVKGYRVIIVMPESMSVERRMLMKAYGAELILTPSDKGMAGAIEKANELANAIEHSFIPSQFENEMNPKAHFETTGVEIYSDLNGNVDVFVAGVGTGGTITGTGEYLKSKNENIEIVAVEPLSSAVLSGEEAGKHAIQGIGAGFVPKALNVKVLDSIIKVSDEDAFKWCRELGFIEGVPSGISSGAALCAAIELAQKDKYEGKNIVVLLPDSGERYLSTPVYQ